jgi:hypothetical protein
LVDRKGKAGEWQTNPIFKNISKYKYYVVEMKLEGDAGRDYEPNTYEVESPARSSEPMVWGIVIVIIALSLGILFMTLGRKKKKRQVPMAMAPFGPTMPMPGFVPPSIPNIPQAPITTKSAKNRDAKPIQKNAAQKLNRSSESNGGLKKIAVKPIDREVEPMFDMPVIKNSAHYGGNGKAEKITVMKDKINK